MHLNLNHIGLPTLDVRRAADFYRSLGFETVVDLPEYVRFRCIRGDATFSLLKVHDKVHSGVTVYFEVDDVPMCYADLGDRGIAFTHAPRTQPWGWTEARLLDPSGNQLCLFHAGALRLQATAK